MDTGTGAKVAQNQQQHVRAAERFDLEVKVDLESDHNFYTGPHPEHQRRWPVHRDATRSGASATASR